VCNELIMFCKVGMFGVGVVMIFHYLSVLSQCSHGGIEGYRENLRQCSIFPTGIQTKYLLYICQMFYCSFTLQLVFLSSGLIEIYIQLLFIYKAHDTSLMCLFA